MTFWKTKKMQDMTTAEWESLCDNCGHCCVHRLEDIDTNTLATTNVACRFLDLYSCKCTDYANRQKNVLGCMKITPQNIGDLTFLPETCGYRLVAQGKDLPSWHYLISGDENAVHNKGLGLREQLISEDEIEGDLQDYIIAQINDENS